MSIYSLPILNNNNNKKKRGEKEKQIWVMIETERDKSLHIVMKAIMQKGKIEDKLFLRSGKVFKKACNFDSVANKALVIDHSQPFL